MKRAPPEEHFEEPPLFAAKLTGTGAFKFDGATIDPAKDNARLGDQLVRVRQLVCDGQWRTLYEISFETGYPEQSVSARLRDLRKHKFGKWTVERRRRATATHGTYEYRVVP